MDTTQVPPSIRTLSDAESAVVTGGVIPWPAIGIVATAVGGVLVYVGSLGRDAALRDRRK